MVDMLNEADMLTWPDMLERLGCQLIPGQTWSGPGHGTPDVNTGTVPGIPGRLATLSWSDETELCKMILSAPHMILSRDLFRSQ